MSKHCDFSYSKVTKGPKAGKWKICFPSGHVFYAKCDCEQEVKDCIDYIIKNHGCP